MDRAPTASEDPAGRNQGSVMGIGRTRSGPLHSSGAGGVPDVCAISRSKCLVR